MTELTIHRIRGGRLLFDLRIPDGDPVRRLTSTIEIRRGNLQQLVRALEDTIDRVNSGMLEHEEGVAEIQTRAHTLYKQIFNDERLHDIREELKGLEPPLVISSSPELNIPWENLHDGEEFIGNRYETARYVLSPRKAEAVMPVKRRAPERCLMIVNPTCDDDLKGIEEQAMQLMDWLEKRSIECTIFSREGAQLEQVLKALSSGEFDIVYFSGHVEKVQDSVEYISEGQRQEYALILNGEVPLRASEIAKAVDNVSLAFINGCRSAIGIESITGAFLARGTRLVVGTFYRIPPQGARCFAEKFFERMLDGERAGASFREARLRVKADDSCGASWAAFIQYGNPEFRLVEREVERELPFNMESMDSEARGVIQTALKLVGDGGLLCSPHLLAALISAGPEEGRKALEEQGVNPHKLGKLIERPIREGKFDLDKSDGEVKLTRNVIRILDSAGKISRAAAHDRIQSIDLFIAFSITGGGKIGQMVETRLGLDLKAVCQRLLKEVGLEMGSGSVTPRPVKLDSDLYENEAWEILTEAKRIAEKTRSSIIGTPHLVMAFLRMDIGPLRTLLTDSGYSDDCLRRALNSRYVEAFKGDGKAAPIPTKNLVTIIRRAEEIAKRNVSGKVTTDDIWRAFTEIGGGSAGRFLGDLLDSDDLDV